MRILYAEDNLQIRTITTERLIKDGFSVDSTKDGEQAMDYLNSTHYDLVILDIMMPKMNGLEVLSWLRKAEKDTPVIMLTAKDSIQDKIYGLDLGADDYVIKPFSYDELLARIKAILRRSFKPIQNSLQVGDLSLNRTTNEVMRQGQSIHLSKKEYSMLEYLMMHAGEVVSRESLERISTNFDYEGYSNVIDVYMRFLRRKIDDPFQTKLIHTVRGFGYVIKVE
ncbi:response regulator transcription factor [Acholeplasma manati]|uniref:Response regulator transcription factor n=1 Tax=Paracholeplasma manati TaxID=591373 RepID=A0ABT2Y7K6_9MOLU|nr:response regulator transcription factor [Paracholeplasma manati]MCV2232732.1 response regulator transcription factor [Paracholeplasma manati]